jgi:hypothetical protein
LKIFLRHLTSTTSTFTKEEWLAILTLSTLWYFHEARNLAIQHLDGQLEEVELVLVGRAAFVPRWVLTGYRAIVERPKSYTLTEDIGDAIGHRELNRLWAIRYHCAVLAYDDNFVGDILRERFCEELVDLAANELGHRTKMEVERDKRDAEERASREAEAKEAAEIKQEREQADLEAQKRLAELQDSTKEECRREVSQGVEEAVKDAGMVIPVEEPKTEDDIQPEPAPVAHKYDVREVEAKVNDSESTEKRSTAGELSRPGGNKNMDASKCDDIDYDVDRKQQKALSRAAKKKAKMAQAATGNAELVALKVMDEEEEKKEEEKPAEETKPEEEAKPEEEDERKAKEVAKKKAEEEEDNKPLFNLCPWIPTSNRPATPVRTNSQGNSGPASLPTAKKTLPWGYANSRPSTPLTDRSVPLATRLSGTTTSANNNRRTASLTTKKEESLAGAIGSTFKW